MPMPVQSLKQEYISNNAMPLLKRSGGRSRPSNEEPTTDQQPSTTIEQLKKMMSSKKYHVNNEVIEQLAAKLSKTIILDSDAETSVAAAQTPRIRDVQSFDDQIKPICASLFRTLTSKQLESTYQRCLAIDLQHAGIEILAHEVEIKLQYKGERVASRRADILLQTPSDKQWIVLELKAVQMLTSEHMKQLQFYMHHLDVDIGYLINFPHDDGFPDLPSTSTTAMYRQTVLSGSVRGLSDRNTRASHNANAQVQIIKVELMTKDDDCRAPPSNALSSPSQSVQKPDDFIVPIARSTGESCKLCLKYNSYCRYHR